MTRRTLTLISFLCLMQTANACSIPVFRYALEHWRPDPFMVVVFHRGDLTDEQVALLDKLAPLGPEGRPTANVMVKAIDVDRETDPSLKRLWELQEQATLPWMAVHAPARSGPPQRIWGGELREENVDRLIQSPARWEVAQRLLDGDSVVWVYLETGNEAADEAAFKLLTTQLAHLETTLRLPEIEAADFGELSVVPEALRLAFSALRVSRDDPQESQFVNMLLHTGPEQPASEPVLQPMAFPIFGRGRAFDALVGDGLKEQTIEDACRFLTGACQCTVKSQNPGIDLLMSIDWDSFIQPTIFDDGAPPPLVGLQEFIAEGTEQEPDAVATVTVDSPTDEIMEAVTTLGNEPSIAQNENGSEGGSRSNGAATSHNNDEFVVSELVGFDIPRNTLLVLGALFLAVVIGTFVVMNRTR